MELIWKKSRRSGASGENCVEVARVPTGSTDEPVIAARDSKDKNGPNLRFLAADFREFAAGVKSGRFDL